MVASSPKIVLRVRPPEQAAPSASESGGALRIDHANKVTIALGGRATPAQSYAFSFDAVLPPGTPQEAVFQECAAELVAGALDGYSGTVLCYGQTGAGKTYTMTGGRGGGSSGGGSGGSNYEQRGLIPRTVSALFAALNGSSAPREWTLRVSYLEIYNEAIYDLLDMGTAPGDIACVDDGAGRLAITGLRAPAVRTEREALTLFFEGETNRVIGEHQLNRESSRSHCVFTLALEATGAVAPPGAPPSAAALRLVDLAGSERVAKTRSEGAVLREAGYINRSLAILEQVVLAATERGRDHVPYRSSRLTHVLRDSLGGGCRTVLVANVWADAAQAAETLSTCRFAARMARLACEVTRNNVAVPANASLRVRQLEREVAGLLEELALQDVWSGRAVASAAGDDQQLSAEAAAAAAVAAAAPRYARYSRERRAALRNTVERFLLAAPPFGSDSDGGSSADDGGPLLAALGIDSARSVREVLRACRQLFQEALARGTAPHAPPPASMQASAGDLIGDVCDSCAGQSGGVGVAPDDARPSNDGAEAAAVAVDAAGPRGGSSRRPPPPPAVAAELDLQAAAAAADLHAPSAALWDGQGPAVADGGGRGSSSSGGYDDAGGVRLAAALAAYRAGPGATKAALLNANDAKARAARRAARALARDVNARAKEIEALRARVDALRAARRAAAAATDNSAAGDPPAAADAPPASAAAAPPKEEEEEEEPAGEELAALAVLRDAKAAYRERRAELDVAASEAEYAARLAEACGAELAADFEVWWQAEQEAQRGSGGGGSRTQSSGGGFGARILHPAAAASAAGAALAAVASAGSVHVGSSEDGEAVINGGRSRLMELAAAADEAEAAGDAGAAAFFRAQAGAAAATASSSSSSGARRQQQREKHGTFSSTQRSAITDKVLLS